MNVKKKSKIPTFKNYAEEAKFWDTHSVADYWDELKPVKVNFRASLKNDLVALRVEAKLKDRVNNIAACWGLSPSSLVRMWIVEKVRAYDNELAMVGAKKLVGKK